ncbi:Ku protein [Streptomyces collinus]|uniref:non-homologous end joining protein Ku n=1 Tax=Streptomyces collinus TaxID=42684 RepID=UPI0033D9A370
MRSIWNGAISFGLVSIPVKLVNATESHSISFRQIHVEDNGRIRYRKVCELDDREVSTEEIGKGYEDADGTVIPITDEDLAHLPIPTTRTIEIVAFVPADRIDPLQMGTVYYLAVGAAPAAKPYTLLREALKRENKVAVAKYALRGRERLGMLRVVGDALTMHGLLWPDEVRAPEGVAPDEKVTVRAKELDLADALMDTLGDVDLDDLHDEYRAALEEVIAAKAAGEALPETPEPETGGKVLDLMAALENSVRAARASRGDAKAPEKGAPEKKAPEKVTAARKATEKKTVEKKTGEEQAGEKRAAEKKVTGKKAAERKPPARKTAQRSAQKTAAQEERKSGRKPPAKKAAPRKTPA